MEYCSMCIILWSNIKRKENQATKENNRVSITPEEKTPVWRPHTPPLLPDVGFVKLPNIKVGFQRKAPEDDANDHRHLRSQKALTGQEKWGVDGCRSKPFNYFSEPPKMP